MKYIIFFLAIGFLTNCSPSLTPYTKSLHEESGWNNDELKRIQFYLSDDIVLYRQLNTGESVIDAGKIKIKDGKKIEEIVFKKGTPGAFLFSPKKNRFAISFEEGNDAPFLIFGPHPKINNRFVLLAKDWNRRTGQVSYKNKVYKTSSSSAYSCLMVDLERARKLSKKTHQAEGRRVD